MKRILSLIIILSMLLSFAACEVKKSSKNDEDEDETEEASSNESSLSDNSNVSSDEDSAPVVPDNNSSDNSNDNTVATEEFKLGTVSNSKYTNEFIGLGFDIPSDWTTKTTKELMEINNVSTDMDFAEYEKKMESTYTFYDFYSVGSNGNNINIVFEKAGADVTPDEYYSDAIIEELKKSYATMNATAEVEKTMTEIDGSDFHSVKMDVTMGEMHLYQLSIAMNFGHEHIAVITITAVDEAMLNTLLSNFYLLG